MNDKMLHWLLENERVRVLTGFYEDNSEVSYLEISNVRWGWNAAQFAYRTLKRLLQNNDTLRYVTIEDRGLYFMDNYKDLIEGLKLNKTIIGITIPSAADCSGAELTLAKKLYKNNPSLHIDIIDAGGEISKFDINNLKP